jgi:hypothetical protein
MRIHNNIIPKTPTKYILLFIFLYLFVYFQPSWENVDTGNFESWTETRAKTATAPTIYYTASKDDDDVVVAKPQQQGPTSTQTITSYPSIHFRTYGNDNYRAAKRRIVREARETGWFKTSLALGPKDLPDEFRERFSDILSRPRGGGYWIWKYPLINMALEEMREGDFLVYLDAGCIVNIHGERRFREYIDLIRNSTFDLMSFQMTGQIEHHWTTERIFQAFNVTPDDVNIRNTGQYVGGILVLRKGQHLKRWIDLVQGVMEKDIWLFSDEYNEESEKLNPNFKQNRHDQSISSLSRKLLGSVVLKDETYPSGNKDVPFWASRKKN